MRDGEKKVRAVRDLLHALEPGGDCRKRRGVKAQEVTVKKEVLATNWSGVQNLNERKVGKGAFGCWHRVCKWEDVNERNRLWR